MIKKLFNKENTLEEENTMDNTTDGLHIYSADWCVPCKMLKAKLREENIKFNAIDVDEYPDLAKEKGVRGVPYVEILKGGETLHKFAGGDAYKKIIEVL